METMRLSRTVSMMKSDDSNFSQPLYLTPPEGVPIRILLRQWGSKKLE